MENLSIDESKLVSLKMTRLSLPIILTSQYFLGVNFLIKYQIFRSKLWQSSITTILKFSCNISITVKNKALEI